MALAHVVHVTAAVDQRRTWARLGASGLACVALVATIAALSSLGRNWALAVYSLSFWHYYLYWLAYRFGTVPPPVFKRDAILMKSVALVLSGGAYLACGPHVVSLFVVAAGFALNALAARMLGSDRTYYGYELGALEPRRITQFPYSWIAHPMLAGNMMAYGGMLLDAEFRRQWWPLGCAHVGLNLGLLLMETAVRAKGLHAEASRPEAVPNPAREARLAALLAIVGTAAGWCLAPGGSPALGAGAGATTTVYAYGMYRCYTAPNAPARKT